VDIFRNVMGLSDQYAHEFLKEFGFFIDSLNRLFELQASVGFDQDGLAALNHDQQNLVKTYLFLMESASTTATGVLRLMSGNLHSDAYALLRILYEIGCLMYYGNQSEVSKTELYETFFSSGLPEVEHRKAEWRLVRKAEALVESQTSNRAELRDLLNNYGSHISEAKMVAGHVAVIGQASASSIFQPNFHRGLYLMALDTLHSLSFFVHQQYIMHNEALGGAEPAVLTNLGALMDEFARTIRPRLRSMRQ